MTIYAFDLATSGNFEDVCYGVILTPNGAVQEVKYNIEHFVSKEDKNKPAEAKLHPVTLMKLTVALEEKSKAGLLFGWGSLGYDCRLLYQESIAQDEALNIAYNHSDLFWQLAIQTGYWISLPEVAQAYGILLDPNFSSQVPTLWKSGDIDKQRQVAHHHLQATRTILAAAQEVITHRRIRWIDKKSGKEATADLYPQTNKHYLLSVLSLPEKAFNKTVNEPIRWLREMQEDEGEVNAENNRLFA